MKQIPRNKFLYRSDCSVIWRSCLNIYKMVQRSSTFMNSNTFHDALASLNCHGECVIISSSSSVSASISCSCHLWWLNGITEEKFCSKDTCFVLLTFGTSTWDRVTKPETRSTLWGLLLLVTRTRDTPSPSSSSSSSSFWSWGTKVNIIWFKTK